MDRVRSLLVVGLLVWRGGLTAASSPPHPRMLAPPVWVFLFPPSVVGGTTAVHTHHAAHTKTAPFPLTYSYTVARRAPSSLAYTVEIYALALHARRAATGSTTLSLPLLPLAHPAIRGEWLRGVVLEHSCALVAGAVLQNLLLSVNSASSSPRTRPASGCQRDITALLRVEAHLLGRAQGFAAHR